MSEIQGYGYQFNLKKNVLVYLTFAGFSLAIAWLFNLDILYAIIMILSGFIFLPAIIVNTYRKMYEQRRFDDATMYIRQVLYSFNRTHKILESLKDVKTLFQDGPMNEILAKAIYHIENEYEAGENPEVEGLNMIAGEYDTRRIRSAHKFMLDAETHGGTTDKTVEILVKDCEQWRDRSSLLLAEIRSRKRIVTTAIIVTFILMLGFVGSIRMLYPVLDYSKMTAVQIATVIAWVLDLWVYTVTDKKTTIDFLEEREIDTESALARYERVVNWDEKEEVKKAVIYAAIPAGTAVVFAFLKYPFVAFLLDCIAVFLAYSAKLGYRIAFKNTVREIQTAFPQWLMSIALLQQSHNIQGSIYASFDGAPAILKPELKKFYDRLQEDPDSIEPFIDFMSYFDIKEITASMQMLYAVQNGTSGSTDTQIAAILERNNKMVDEAEKLSNSDRIASVLALFLAPQVVCGAKIFVDMLAIFVVFFAQTTQYIGG